MLGFIFNGNETASSLFIVVFCIMHTKFAVSYRI